MWPDLQETVETVDLVTIIEEILNGKLHLLRSELSPNLDSKKS